MNSTRSRIDRRLMTALLFSVLLIVMAPFLAEIRRILAAGLANRFVLVMSGLFGLSIGLLLLAAVFRIVDRRVLRFTALGFWAAMMILQFWLWTRSRAEVSAVERIHFVFYSVLAMLFYRAFSRRRDLSGALLAFFAATTVGTLDEGMQWLVPVRAADFADVRLNAYSALAGVFLGVALVGVPGDWRPRLERRSLVASASMASLCLIVVAGYLQIAHLGFLVQDPAIGSFRSLHSRDELIRLSARRAVSWARRPPGPPSDLGPLEIEDYYRSEAGWHVLQRNRFFDAEDFGQTAKEMAVLEAYFNPFLDLHNDAGVPFRFSPQLRARVERGLGDGALDSTWISPVGRQPKTIFLRPTPSELWFGLALILGLVWATALGYRRG